MEKRSAIRIREATEQDQQKIAQLLLEAYQQYENVMSKERWQQYRQSIQESAYRDGPFARIVALLDEKIVGSAQLYLSSEHAYGRPELQIHSPIMRLLAVSPKVRGRGIATELIKESARRAIALGASTLHLHTSDMMESAVRLYERLGFERAFDKDMYNGDTLVKSYRLNLENCPLLT